MPTWEVLNSQVHADLRLGAPVVDERLFVQIVATEFESAAARFPILFSKKADTGAFYAGAMLGFKPGRPLLAGSRDLSDAQRLFDVEREGFYVSDDSIVIDRDHPRFGSAEGKPVFDWEGKPDEPLRRVQRALAQLSVGLEATDQFIRACLDLKLIEPIDLTFRFDDGEHLVLDGLYTISRDALGALEDAAALDLFRRGWLHLAYAVIGSLQHVPRLARLHNDRLAEVA
ncbi:SapC family protein [Sphingomonas sp. NFR15]|uniref:SapC family protein n=1 Tax=Sphingomonas sp. NFR15 TaxID=1566282 RepID=UPI000884B315|nr:SapC family protein [Sphingomonas sp. NFR15]SDA17123.1 SapC protein [Sphingomonas sp. NFR15]